VGCIFFLAGCGGQQQKSQGSFEVNRLAKDSFLFARKLVDTTDRGGALLSDGMSAIIVPERMGSEEEDFRDTKKPGFEMPCQCVFKNDSLAVTSALGWEGGFAYIAKASRRQTVNSFMGFGRNRKWVWDRKEYKEEIEVPSLKNTLVISKPFPLKEGELLYGWFDIETPLFFEITGEGRKDAQRHKMRVYFSCNVSPTNLY